MATFFIKRNDTAPPITATLTADSVAVDVDGATVRFHMAKASNGEVKVDAAATVDDGPNGEVSYSWVAADTETAGWYRAEWEVTFADGTIRTFPNPGYTNVHVGGDLT